MGDKMSDKTNEPVKELKGLTEQASGILTLLSGFMSRCSRAVKPLV